MEDREQKVSLCKLCEQAERYNDMLRVISEVARMPGGLSTEERNLFSVASKNSISARRTSWRLLNSHQHQENENNAAFQQAHQLLTDLVEKELETISGQVLETLDKYLIKSASSPETKVFYHKMKGDYLRYLAEFQKDKKREASAQASLEAYTQATEEAQTLPASNTIRLGLALNFSVFYYEIKEDCQKACEIAREAYESATDHAKSTGQSNTPDRKLILQLLGDNLKLWTSEPNEDTGATDAKY